MNLAASMHASAAPDTLQRSALRLGSTMSIWPPVVLAPMAGITSYPFRSLCREFGAGLYVSEMVLASGVARDHACRKTSVISSFHELESPRSVQLYGVNAETLSRATERLVAEQRVDHIDLNFGCPVRKVTRCGGGASIPARPRVLRKLVRAVVSAAGSVPVTAKFRIGLTDHLTTSLDSGKICEEEGLAAVSLHARTAAQLYDGNANWDAIAELVGAISIPVIGNGDIWTADDALKMMKHTKCAGVMIGRGCLGRPWLFRDLARAFDGDSLDSIRQDSAPPLASVIAVMRDHLTRSLAWFGMHGQSEHSVVCSMRKHWKWYLTGFDTNPRDLGRLMEATSADAVHRALDCLSASAAAVRLNASAAIGPRGKGIAPSSSRSSTFNSVSLPAGFLQTLDDDVELPPSAEGRVEFG